jgi:hypothetical protein
MGSLPFVVGRSVTILYAPPVGVPPPGQAPHVKGTDSCLPTDLGDLCLRRDNHRLAQSGQQRFQCAVALDG